MKPIPVATFKYGEEIKQTETEISILTKKYWKANDFTQEAGDVVGMMLKVVKHLTDLSAKTFSVIFFVNFKQILSGTFGPHTSTS